MILETIRERRSCRTYDPRPLEPGVQAEIEKLIRRPLEGPFGGKVRFRLVPAGRASAEKKLRLGTYGFVQGAPAFIAGAVAKAEHDLEDYGWCMEKVILGLTGLGLGTCWLGGSFRRTAFARAVDLAADEVQPAVSPVGHPASRKSPVDSLASVVAGSRGRRRWEELFLFDRDSAGPWVECLEAVRLAPSAVNGQPWRVVQGTGSAVFHFCRVQAAGRPMQRVDMGIAMCHFELAAREVGLDGSWEEFPGAVERPGLEYLASWVPDAPGARARAEPRRTPRRKGA
jgi:nitroreductase